MNKILLFLVSVFLFTTTIYSQDFKNLVSKGDSCFQQRELHQAISFYQNALKIKPEKLLSNQNEVFLLSKLGDSYFELAEYQTALEFFFKFIEKDYIKSKDSILTSAYNRIGRSYGNLKQNKQALKFYKKAKETAGLSPEAQGVAYNNIADVYLQMKKNKEAKEYFLKAEKYFEEANYANGLIVANINLGTLALEENKIEFAEQLLTKSLQIAKDNFDTTYIVISEIYLAEYYIKILDFDNAEMHLKWALKNAIHNNMPQYIDEAYGGFVKLYETKKDYENAFKYLKLFKANSDSLFNLNSSKEYAELEAKYSIREKEKENDRIKKEQQLTESRVLAQRKYIWMLLGVVILSILSISLVIYQRVKRAKARKFLEHQNKEILKSKKQLEDLNYQYEKLISKYEGGTTKDSPELS